MAIWRPPTTLDERTLYAVRSMSDGSLDGRVIEARPVSFSTGVELFNTDEEYEADNNLGVGDDAEEEEYHWQTDTFKVKSLGDQELFLTYIPVDQSVDIYWGGAYLPESSWTLHDDRLVTLPDPDHHYHVGRKLTVRYVWRDEDQGTEDPEAPLPPWSVPLRINSVPNVDTNDSYGFNEAHMCVLDSGIVVVSALSVDSYAIHCWAIDCSGDTPVIGSEAIFNADSQSWASDPVLPDDPKRRALGDLNECVALGPYTFGYTGEADESYHADGTPTTGFGDTLAHYGHVASLFSVNPTTLAITRTQFVVGDWDNNEAVESEATSARWGNKMVIVRDRSDNPSHVWIVSPDGTLDIFNTTSWCELTAPVVSGDSCFLFGQTLPYSDGVYHLLQIDLTTGTFYDLGSKPEISDYNFSWFGVKRSDGTPAWIVSTEDSGYNGDAYVAIFNVGSLDLVHLSDTAEFTGWTGGWYSNVRDIDAMPDGTLVASWVDDSGDDPVMRYALVDGTTVVQTGLVSDFSEPFNSYAYGARISALPDGRVIAMWLSFRYNGGNENYGIYLSATTSPLDELE